MGYEDRDYFRAERPSPGLGASLGSLSAMWLLIGTTVIAFLVQSGMQNAGNAGFVADHLALSVEGLKQFQVWQLFSYMLLHADGGHLFWNMIGLFFFLSVLQPLVPRNKLLLYYVLAGLGGALGRVAWTLAGMADPGTIVVGASGAVSGILAMAALRAPKTPFLLFFFIPCPLWLIAVLYLGGDLMGMVGGTSGRVASDAHIGGALVGLIIHFRPWERWSRRRRVRPSVSRNVDPSYPPPPPLGAHANRENERRQADDARVDELLERIHTQGMDSLSEEEREFLKRVSKRYRAG